MPAPLQKNNTKLFLNSEYFSIITCLISGKPWILFHFHWKRRGEKMLGIFLNCFFLSFFFLGDAFMRSNWNMRGVWLFVSIFPSNSFSLYYFSIPTHPEKNVRRQCGMQKKLSRAFTFSQLLWTFFSLFHCVWPKWLNADEKSEISKECCVTFLIGQRWKVETGSWRITLTLKCKI